MHMGRGRSTYRMKRRKYSQNSQKGKLDVCTAGKALNRIILERLKVAVDSKTVSCARNKQVSGNTGLAVTRLLVARWLTGRASD